MNVQRLFCINFGRDSKPGRTDELQIDDDEYTEGRERTERDGETTERTETKCGQERLNAYSIGVAKNTIPEK